MKIEQVLEMYRDFELVTNKDTINTEIQLVTVIDAPDIMYCRKADFVLTSAYIFKDNVNDLRRVIKSLSATGASAIGIKINRFLKTIPQEIIDVGNSLSFPIIFIPNHYAFADIITPVLTEILNEKLAEIIKTEKIHTHYTEMLLQNRSITEMFQYLKKVIHMDFSYYDYYSHENYHTIVSPEFSLQDGYTQIVHGKDYPIGKFVLHQPKENVQHMEIMAIEHCLDAVHLKVSHLMAKDLEEERYRNDLINDICINNINSREELANRAKVYGWDFSGSWCCVIFDIDHYKNQFEGQEVNNQQLEEEKERIFSSLKQSWNQRNITYRYFTKSDSIIFLILVTEDLSQKIRKSDRELFCRILEELKEHTELTMTVAIGEIQNDILEAHRSYQQAYEAIKIGRVFQDSNSINFYSDICIYKYIKDVVKKEETAEGLLRPIYKILEYDKKNNKNYMHTLSALVKNGWNIQKTADEEYMHYNTVKYRYHKIFDILEKDYDNANTHFDLSFAYRVYQMIKK